MGVPFAAPPLSFKGGGASSKSFRVSRMSSYVLLVLALAGCRGGCFLVASCGWCRDGLVSEGCLEPPAYSGYNLSTQVWLLGLQ